MVQAVEKAQAVFFATRYDGKLFFTVGKDIGKYGSDYSRLVEIDRSESPYFPQGTIAEVADATIYRLHSEKRAAKKQPEDITKILAERGK